MSLADAAAKLLAGCMLLHAVRHGREGACPAAPCVHSATVALTLCAASLDAAFLVLSEPRALWMRIVVPLIRPDRAMQVRASASALLCGRGCRTGLTRATPACALRAACRASRASSRWPLLS
jgi:hypothetical protein